MNHRAAQINDVPSYAHTFSLFSDFFLFSLFCMFFVHLPFIFSFFHKSAVKNR
jgi:hypothetical protein